MKIPKQELTCFYVEFQIEYLDEIKRFKYWEWGVSVVLMLTWVDDDPEPKPDNNSCGE